MHHWISHAVRAVVTVSVSGASLAQDPVTVAADGSGRHRTIQSAVDAAPKGAVITIAPGVYEETISISKPVTLRGSGWRKTVIRSPARAKVLAVRAARGVLVDGVKIASKAPWIEDGIASEGVVSIDAAELELRNCVVCGGPGSGIDATLGADLVVRDCLVAVVGGSGVLARQGRKGRVHVVDSDLRSCRYAGVRIAKDSDNTTVERCRISGAKWHGIRYDHCSPQIISNVFFDNERTAIYASGKTRATVLLNLFLSQGLTCWFHNRDTLSSNTFVGRDTGISVLGASNPTIRRNIFHGNRLAIRAGNIGGDREGALAEGAINATENVFWRNDQNFRWTEGMAAPDPFADKTKNVELDPRLANPDAKDFTLAKGSPALERSAGATKHIPVASPWPLQTEEIALQREAEAAQRAAAAKVAALRISGKVGRGRTMAQKSIRAIRQTEDRALRQIGVAEVRKGLKSGKPADQSSALATIASTAGIDFDRTGLRNLVEDLAKSSVPELRIAALMALLPLGNRPKDVDRLAAELKSCETEVLQGVTQILRLQGRQRITEQTEGLFLALLIETDDDLRRRLGLMTLTSKDITPAIEKRLLQMCTSSRLVRDQVVHFVLGTLPVKSKLVIDELLDVAAEGGKHRAKPEYHWLRHGVPESQRVRIADFLIEIFPSRRDGERRQCLDVLEVHANKSHLYAISAMGRNTPGLSDAWKQQIGGLLARICNRAR